MNDCIICLQKCVIPVEVTCFLCSSNLQKLNCLSTVRFCYECAIRFLTLDKKKRDMKVKCIYCHSTVSPQNLMTDECLRKDFLSMKLDTTEYICPYCSKFKGSHLDLEKHMFTSCEKRWYFCSCRVRVQMEDKENHLYDCSHHRLCEDCDEMVHTNHYFQHLLTKHQQTECFQCKELVPIQELQNHMEHDCLNRIKHCCICQEQFEQIKLVSHLIEHQKQYRLQLERITNIRTHCREQMELVRKQLDECYEI